MNSNNEIQGYKMYPMLHFRRKSSSGVTPSVFSFGHQISTQLSIIPAARSLLLAAGIYCS